MQGGQGGARGGQGGQKGPGRAKARNQGFWPRHEKNLLRYLAGRGCYRPHGCGEAGKRIGSLCAIEVGGLKRRPPTEVGGLSLEFRV